MHSVALQVPDDNMLTEQQHLGQVNFILDQALPVQNESGMFAVDGNNESNLILINPLSTSDSGKSIKLNFLVSVFLFA